MHSAMNYRLLKDLPNLKAGAIFVPFISDSPVYCNKVIRYEHEGFEKVHFLPPNVENNPEWFEKVEENKYTKQEIEDALDKIIAELTK